MDIRGGAGASSPATPRGSIVVVGLTDEQLRAFVELPSRDGRMLLDPTFLPEHYLPQLLVLQSADPDDLTLVAQGRGWTPRAAGEVIGAATLAGVLHASGAISTPTRFELSHVVGFEDYCAKHQPVNG